MAEFASQEETLRALEILLELQSKDPNKLDGIVHKYANPFTSWPLLAEPTRTFLGFFEASAQTVETGGSQQNINPKLEEMVEEFTREFAAAKEQRVTASTASKKFISVFLENARKSNVPLPEIQALSVDEGAAPVPQERVQNIISTAVQHPGPPEEKLLVFHALTAFASEQPDKNIASLVPRAVEVTRVTEALSVSGGAFATGASFSAIAKNNFQRGVAGILDVVVPPAAKEAIIDNILLGRLATAVNHPEKLPPSFMETAMNRWGERFVTSSWFTQFRADANRMMTERAGALKIKSGFINFASDLATIIFRAPPDENFLAYMETHRFLGARGVPAGNIFFARNALMGIGGRVIRAGIKYTPLGILRRMRIKAPAAVGAGILSGGILGRLLRSNRGIFSPVVTRGVNSLMGFFGRLRRVQTKINGWLIAGAIAFLFVLIILPIFGQSMIDTAISTAEETGMGNDAPVAPPDFGPINGSVTDCITSHSITIEGHQTLALSADRASRIQDISQKYPQLGCYSQVLSCPSTQINISAFSFQSGGLGGYAPHSMPGNIIFYPAFFNYNDYYFARTLAHELMHEVEYFHPDIYDAFVNEGYCGPLGTYKAGTETDHETMAEAAGLYMVGNPLLQELCKPAYDFMSALFSQCQQ